VSATCFIHALIIFIYFERHTHQFVLEMTHSVYRKDYGKISGSLVS